MSRKKAFELDGVDLLLLLVIAGLAIFSVCLVLPMLPSLGMAIWGLCRAVLCFWKWPWWIWTMMSTLGLMGLLWLHKKYE